MKLWIIRHAKSSWSHPGLRDIDRPLNKRGERDGPRMAAWLAAQSDPAEWIWASPAARAVATADFARRGFDLSEAAVATEAALYHASPEDIIEVVRRTPPDLRSAAVVAHNPGLTFLVNLLGPEPVTDNLPTFGVARFDLPCVWIDLVPGIATLDVLVGPKTIEPA